MGCPILKLQQDCHTRWNSQFYMIKTLLQCRWPVAAVISGETITKRQYQILGAFFRELASARRKVLEPFEVATVVLSKETNIFLLTVFPIVYGLKKQMAIHDDDSPVIRQFKAKIVSAIVKRWDLENFVPSNFSILITALDPRFRQSKFLTKEHRDQVKAELILQKLVQNEQMDSTETPRPKKNSIILIFITRRE
jgi:hypothetical protein